MKCFSLLLALFALTFECSRSVCGAGLKRCRLIDAGRFLPGQTSDPGIKDAVFLARDDRNSEMGTYISVLSRASRKGAARPTSRNHARTDWTVEPSNAPPRRYLGNCVHSFSMQGSRTVRLAFGSPCFRVTLSHVNRELVPRKVNKLRIRLPGNSFRLLFNRAIHGERPKLIPEEPEAPRYVSKYRPLSHVRHSRNARRSLSSFAASVRTRWTAYRCQTPDVSKRRDDNNGACDPTGERIAFN